MFESLYITEPRISQIFGEYWCGPPRLVHAAKTLVARYPSKAGGDGQDVEVYCTAMPATFYRVLALATLNSIGESQPSYSLSTGSSEGLLAASIARAISSGMLGLDRAS